MKKLSIALTIAVTTAGCAIVEDPSLEEGKAPFSPIETKTDARTVEHGVVTVREIHQRSDIVVMPPSIEHVVWKKRKDAVDESVRPEARASKRKGSEGVRQRRVKERWPLLEEDMNFASEIGRVPMCDRKAACREEEGCTDLEPCQSPERYECYRVKIGDYCLERGK